jgi:hypothetical protein
MSQDHNDIYTIVERLRILEEGLTPTTVKHGLNKQQKSVNQLSATFKPKTVAVLTAPKDPKNPMAGKLVGGGAEESIDLEDDPLKDRTTIMSEADMAEDVLEKVKNSFKDFIKQAEEKIEDADIKEKKKEDSDLKKKEKRDRDLIAKVNPHLANIDEEGELDSALSGVMPAEQPAGEEGVSIKESLPVKTITNECGDWEMHGNEHDGFEIRRGGRALPSRFSSLDEAEMALEMFAHRRRQADESQDYMEER